MPKSTSTSIQEALDAASLDLKHWASSILPFESSSLDSSGRAVVDSQITDLLLEFVKPMYRGQRVYFAWKYIMESVHNNGRGGWITIWQGFNVFLVATLEGPQT